MSKKTTLFIILFLLFSSKNFAQKRGFANVTKQAGINHVFKVYEGTFGGGATVLDINNDGFEDIFIASGMNDDKLYVNHKNGTFTDIYAKSGLKLPTKYVSQGAISADVNKDGWVDIFITTIMKNPIKGQRPEVARAENLLFLNNGDNTFHDATSDFNLDQAQTFSTGASFGDFNNDGYPDIYVANYFEAYQGELNILNDAMIVGSNALAKGILLLNMKGKYFKNVYEEYGLNHKGFGFAGVFTDFDNDHDLDLIIVNDFGYKSTKNKLYENKFPEAKFEDISKKSHMNLPINGMGVAVGDINNDGWMDYYFTNIRACPLMINEGKTKEFKNKNMELGVGLPRLKDSFGQYMPVSWGTNFADFDHDGDLDLFASNGCLNPNVEPNPDSYFENLGNKFINKFDSVGLEGRGIGRGSVTFDYDNDGDLDLLVVHQQPITDLAGAVSLTTLYRNDISNGNWLKIRLKGIDSESKGIGARVEIWLNGKKQIREIDGGSSHESQNSSIAHFGIGTATTLDSVVVYWVGGKKQSVGKQKANTEINLTEDRNILTEARLETEKFYSLLKFALGGLITLGIAWFLFWRKKT